MVNSMSLPSKNKHYDVFKDLRIDFQSSEEKAPHYLISMKDLKIQTFEFDPKQSGILMSDAFQTVNINNVGIFFNCTFFIDVNLTGMLLPDSLKGVDKIVTLFYRLRIDDLKYSTELEIKQKG